MFAEQVLPVRSSRISTSVVFRSSLTRAGMPPQFLRAILLSSLALPYTRFRRAPQALRWTSVIRWSSKSTRSWIPPCRRIWGHRKVRGINGGAAESWWIIHLCKLLLYTVELNGCLGQRMNFPLWCCGGRIPNQRRLMSTFSKLRNKSSSIRARLDLYANHCTITSLFVCSLHPASSSV